MDGLGGSVALGEMLLAGGAGVVGVVGVVEGTRARGGNQHRVKGNRGTNKKCHRKQTRLRLHITKTLMPLLADDPVFIMSQ